MARAPRKVPNAMMRRPQPAAVGSTPLEPLPQAPALRAKKKRSSPPQGKMEQPTTLWRPKPPNTVLAGRAFRAPDPEVSAALGGAPMTTEPEAAFQPSVLSTDVSKAQRVGARPPSQGTGV